VSETVSQEGELETKLEAKLEKVRVLLADGMLENASLELTQLWLKHPEEKSVIELYAQMMHESGRAEQANKVRSLLSVEIEKPALTFFEAGFSLIDARQFELAAMLLSQCDSLNPDDPVVNYELGFALMTLARFDSAVERFEKALAVAPDFDTTLNLSVCYVLTRDLKKAQEQTSHLIALATEEEELKEVAHRKVVLKRLESFANKKVLSGQDWLFILYGGILLRPNRKPDGKQEEIKGIAETLLIAKGFLEGMHGEIETIEYYNTQSRPLARALSDLMEIPLEPYKGPSRPEKALLVMDWATDIIGPHESFVDNQGKRIIFAYGLPGSEPLPLVPDIASMLSDNPLMPWDDRLKEDKIESFYSKIFDKARDLENDPDVLKEIQDLILYYEPKREQLVFNNPQHFPQRPEYSAEILTQEPKSE
jgi:Flp pilus assembly protein TadD